MNNLQVTLNKANNLKAQLKKEVGGGSNRASLFETYGSVNDITAEVDISLGTFEAAELKKIMQTEIDNALVEHIKKLNYTTDFFNLKEAILKGNVVSGLSDLLCEISKTKNLLRNAEQVVLSVKNNRTKTIDEALALIFSEKQLTDNKKSSVQISLKIHSDLKKAQAEVKLLKKQLTTLEDEKFSLNNNHKINISLTGDTLELLGLDVPVENDVSSSDLPF